jgi:hypothetical protein
MGERATARAEVLSWLENYPHDVHEHEPGLTDPTTGEPTPTPYLSIWRQAADAHTWTFEVRLYVEPGDDSEAAQATLDDLADAVEEILPPHAVVDRSEVGQTDDDRQLFVESFFLILPRASVPGYRQPAGS